MNKYHDGFSCELADEELTKLRRENDQLFGKVVNLNSELHPAKVDGVRTGTNTKKFNLKAAKNGAPMQVIWDDETFSTCRFVAMVEENKDYPVLVTGPDGQLFVFNEAGFGFENETRLEMVLQRYTRELWIVLTENDLGGTCFGCCADAREYAERFPRSVNATIHKVTVDLER